jgi:hypothetical protein
MKIGFIRTMLFSLAVSGALAASAVHAQNAPKTDIPPSTLKSISTPDKLDTPIGKLTFSDGVPTGDTVRTLYDNLDRTRGVTVYLDNLGAVAIRAFLSSLAAQGADAPNHFAIFEQLMDSAGTTPFRSEKGTAFEGGWRVPGIMTWPWHIPAGVTYGEMMSHIDCWSTLAAMAGITPPPPGEMKDNNSKPIYFDSIDSSICILGKSPHSARKSCIYINGEYLNAIRVDIGGDPKEPWLNIAWKFLWTAKDSWLGPTQNLGSLPRYTTSPWIPTRNTTWSSMAQRRRARCQLCLASGQAKTTVGRLDCFQRRFPISTSQS